MHDECQHKFMFFSSVSRSHKNPLASKRIANIISYLTYEAYCYTSRGLYEEHKFLFTLLMSLKLDLQKGVISIAEFQVFIKGE